MILDHCLPQHDFNEIHSIMIPATPEKVYLAIKQVMLSDILLARLLFQFRFIPTSHPDGHQTEPSMLEHMVQNGFSAIAEKENREVVFGVLSQPWKLSGGKMSVVNGVDSFIQFHDDQVAKIAANFFIEQTHHPNEVKLITETRVLVPDRKNRRRFAIYWGIIYPGSALLRRMWLRAIKKKAISLA